MPFDYKSFIEEITILVDEAKNFQIADRHYQSESFRKWKHKTADLINQIGRQRYSINSNLQMRQFHAGGYSLLSESEQQEIFNRDLADSINELNLVIEQYQKYGDPRATKKSSETITTTIKIQIPEKVTLRWLIDNLPIKVWLWFGGLLFTSAALGFGLRSLLIGQ